MARVGTPINVTSLVSVKSLALFFRHISVLVKSGISIFQAISDSASFANNRKLSKAAKTVVVDVSNGMVLSSALQKHPDVFPVNLVASVWCGELSGKLDVVLDEIATELEEETKDQGFARIGWIITKLTILNLFLIIPVINPNEMFTHFLNDSGGINQRLQYIFQKYIQALPTVITLSIIAIIFWSVWPFIKRIPTIRLLLDKLLLITPIWGDLTKDRALSRVFRNMELLTSAGISSNKAWEAASLTSKNAYLAVKFRNAASISTSSNSSSETMRYAKVLDEQEIGIIAAGEKAGRVSESFQYISKYSASNIDRRKKIGKVWSTGALVIGSTILMGVVLAIYWSGYRDFLLNFIDKNIP